ncbi:putative HNHc nuclease [Limosilactobacillus oris]|uniref:putative HNHc nuclease n=1 Tax=Limosilactobacillus oris TaxID=1632 RepID=UPI0022358FFA|nr:putative HNHc nuclease [Limosilactobacillus oris]MCW4388757.1 putative HNHc nuclease [Limosilactobacillus oris]
MQEEGTAFLREGYIVVAPDNQPNERRIRRLNDGQLDGARIRFEFVDNRLASTDQRNLFFALLDDIVEWSGNSKPVMKKYFYDEFQEENDGREISLADDSDTTMTEATKLINNVIDFIFFNGVPVNEGYELLPRNEAVFQYKCLMSKHCLICGRHADTHHVDAVGMGRDRNHIDHTKHRLMALCRDHHTEYHKIGSVAFAKKYLITRLGIRLNADDLKKIGVRGDYEQTTN